jgi:hypothetical protein
MPTVDRTARFEALPQRLKDVSNALKEMNEVITGGSFDIAQIWGATAVDNITTFMDSQTVLADLATTVHNLLNGLPGGSSVSSAIQTAIDGVQSVITKVQSTAADLGGSRLDAFKRLASPHSTNPGYTYQPAPAAGFGLVPAIAGLVAAAADTEFSPDSVLGPINQVMDVANAAQGVADFVEYAVASVELLKKALTA